MEITFLTHCYPFGTGEEFIEAELAYLARGFERVHLVPTAAVAPTAVVRPVPAGVVVRHDVMAAFRRARLHGRAQRAVAAEWDVEGRALLHAELADLRFWQPPRLTPRRLRLALQYVGHALMVRDALRLVPTPRRVYSYWLGAGVLGAALAGCGPLVARAHGADLYPDRDSSHYAPLQAATIGRLSRLVCISAHGLAFARARWPQLADRIVLHRLGVEAAGEASHGQDGRLHILSCARLVAVKRVDRLVRAMARFPLPAVWTHLGDGPLGPDLQAQAATLPPHVSVRWWGDCTHAAVLNYYRREPVDVFVNTSVSEGLPVSMMEALSFGVPVVAPDVGGISELVQPAGGVLLPPSCKPDEIVTALFQFATQSREERLTLRHLARAAWAGRVDAAVQYPQFVELLNHL